MVKHDGVRMFYRGAFTRMLGYFHLYWTAILAGAFSMNDYTPYKYFIPFTMMIGTILAHPFFVLSTQLQYVPHNKAKVLDNTYSNTVRLANHIWKT
jgi:hypothetical protein